LLFFGKNTLKAREKRAENAAGAASVFGVQL